MPPVYRRRAAGLASSPVRAGRIFSHAPAALLPKIFDKQIGKSRK